MVTKLATVTVHCPRCGHTLDVPVELRTIEPLSSEHPDMLGVGFNYTTVRHVCELDDATEPTKVNGL